MAKKKKKRKGKRKISRKTLLIGGALGATALGAGAVAIRRELRARKNYSYNSTYPKNPGDKVYDDSTHFDEILDDDNTSLKRYKEIRAKDKRNHRFAGGRSMNSRGSIDRGFTNKEITQLRRNGFEYKYDTGNYGFKPGTSKRERKKVANIIKAIGKFSRNAVAPKVVFSSNLRKPRFVRFKHG